MPQPQSAICAEGETFGIFLTATLAATADAADRLRRVAADLPTLTLALAVRTGEPRLSSAISFGAAVWPRVWAQPAPAELVPFQPLRQGPRTAPATPADLFLHFHSPRHDANFALARAVIGRLAGAVQVVEEIHGFRSPDCRDLTGFVDGTENPQGDERPAVALVGDEDPAFAGGSYVAVQRYVHDLSRWEELLVTEQEGVIGRGKVDDHELEEGRKPPTAHIARVVIEENGEELQILRHSLPYGTTTENGLYFVAYGRSPGPFRRMLQRMVGPAEDGLSDRLLDYTRAVTGGAFFAPSVDFLEAVA
jgi:putative iron-dependent peroxidase